VTRRPNRWNHSTGSELVQPTGGTPTPDRWNHSTGPTLNRWNHSTTGGVRKRVRRKRDAHVRARDPPPRRSAARRTPAALARRWIIDADAGTPSCWVCRSASVERSPNQDIQQASSHQTPLANSMGGCWVAFG
jgi:hypothetical protein